MADFKSKLTLDGSDFSKTMDDAGKSVNDFQKKTQDASKQVDDLGKSTKKTASELLNEMKNMEGLGRSTSNYRSQLAQMTRQIQDLTINYNQMSNEMKNSDFGREVAAQIQELTKNAADMKDQVQDAANSVKLLASDTKNLDAAKSAIEGLSAGFQLFASAGILGEQNTEKVVKALAKLKAIESATNAVIKIANILNKDSILMLKIKELQTRAATRATIAQTSATGAATVAQKAFNVAAKANPYVLLATAILAVVGALVAFSNDTEEATYEMAEYETEAEKMRKANDSIAESTGQAAGTMISSFLKMKAEWQNLSSTMEKTDFIKKNADKFKELGLKINDVVTAEEVFTKKSDIVIKAFTLRAKAAAYAAYATKKYQEAIELREKAQTNHFKAGDKIPEDWSENDKQFYSEWAKPDKNGNYYFSGNSDLLSLANLKYAGDAQTAQRLAGEALENNIDLEQEYIDLLREHGLLLDENNDKGNNKGSNKTDKFDENSLSYWQKQVQELQTKLNGMSIDDKDIDSVKQKLKEAQDMVEYIQKMLNQKATLKYNVSDLFKAKKEVDDLKARLVNMSPDDEWFDSFMVELRVAEDKLNDIQNKLGVSINPQFNLSAFDKAIRDAETLQKQIDDMTSRLSKMSEDDDMFSSLSTQIQEAEDKLQAIDNNVKIELGLSFNMSDMTAVQKQIDALKAELVNMSPDDELFDNFSTQLKTMEDKLAQMKTEVKMKLGIDFDLESLAAVEQRASELQAELDNTDPHSDRYKEIVTELALATQQAEDLKKAMDDILADQKPFNLLPPETGNTIDSLSKEISRIQSQLQDTEPGTEQWDYLAACLVNWQNALDEIQNKYDAIGRTQIEYVKGVVSGVSSLNSAVASAGKAVDSLAEGWDDSKSAVENITGTVSNVLTIMQSIITVIDTMNALSELLSGTSLVQWMLEKKKNQEKSKGVGLELAETGAKSTNAGLSVIEAIAGVIKSASEIPMVGWIIGLGAVAAVIAAIASAPKFAKGGIVPGNSFSGDNITAQVNSGEMILNTSQQAKLFDLLNGSGSLNSGSNKVEFVIKGQELKGVLNNYDKKMSRV